jgi:hypothetical protein
MEKNRELFTLKEIRLIFKHPTKIKSNKS